MNRFVILLDGDLTITSRLKDQVGGLRAIAADGGIRHADSLEITPELWLGDFDSSPDNVADHLNSVPRIAYPADKDVTDGEIAIDAAIERGATELMLVGAFGGARADHALLHKLVALKLAARGVPVLLTDGVQEGCPVLPGKHEFDLPRGTLFSLVGITGLSGLTISGAKWPLASVEVPLGSSLTLSNQVDGRLRIELKSGQALLIAQVGRS